MIESQPFMAVESRGKRAEIVANVLRVTFSQGKTFYAISHELSVFPWRNRDDVLVSCLACSVYAASDSTAGSRLSARLPSLCEWHRPNIYFVIGDACIGDRILSQRCTGGSTAIEGIFEQARSSIFVWIDPLDGVLEFYGNSSAETIFRRDGYWKSFFDA